MEARLVTRTIPLCLACVLGCTDDDRKKSEHVAPAKLEKATDESTVNTVILTADAEKRLGVTTAAAARQRVARKRMLGGVVEVPIGKSITISAPLAGTLLANSESAGLVAGSRVASGETLIALRPILAPEHQVQNQAERAQIANAAATVAESKANAEADVEQTRAQIEVARIALQRAERLVRDNAGSQRVVDEAKAALRVAEANAEGALIRQRALQDVSLDRNSGEIEPIVIASPQNGIIRTVTAAPGETVSAGKPLFEVIDVDVLWIRVPAYAGLADEVARDGEVLVSRLGGRTIESQREPVSIGAAKPVLAPPAADPLTSTVDLVYEIPNPEGKLRPGERVSVIVPLQGDAESLTVPRAAILYDIHGGAWVYCKTGDRAYQRVRVEVEHTAGDVAVLERGPAPGTEVVVDGVAEIFGTEFGAGK